MDDIEYRPATHEDYEDVVAFTEDTWTDLDVGASDYIPDVYHDWIDGDRQRTVVADAGGAIAGIAQVVLLSAYEAWAQGMRVNPAFRGEGVAMGINDDLFAWAREQGATVARNMVFSWNQAGLGQSRANGFDPVTEFRWLHPEPDESGAVESDASGAVESADPDAAWSFWTDSDAREHLGGLGLDMDETWALRELTRELFARAAAETALLTAGDEDGTHGVSYRTRTVERETDDGETETWAEYGVAAWEDVAAGEQLLAAISADAATCGADRTRVLIPETAQYVTDGAYLRAKISEEPDFVLAADLTGTR
jgi:GNAT superfamily N-acetyltransferase